MQSARAAARALIELQPHLSPEHAARLAEACTGAGALPGYALCVLAVMHNTVRHVSSIVCALDNTASFRIPEIEPNTRPLSALEDAEPGSRVVITGKVAWERAARRKSELSTVRTKARDMLLLAAADFDAAAIEQLLQRLVVLNERASGCRPHQCKGGNGELVEADERVRQLEVQLAALQAQRHTGASRGGAHRGLQAHSSAVQYEEACEAQLELLHVIGAIPEPAALLPHLPALMGAMGSTSALTAAAVRVLLPLCPHLSAQHVGSMVELVQSAPSKLRHLGLLSVFERLDFELCAPHLDMVLALLGGEETTVTWRARDVLVGVSALLSADVVAAVAHHLKSPMQHVRQAAASVLGELGEAAAPHMLAMLCMLSRDCVLHRPPDPISDRLREEVERGLVDDDEELPDLHPRSTRHDPEVVQRRALPVGMLSELGWSPNAANMSDDGDADVSAHYGDGFGFG